MGLYYYDSSALVKLYVEEPGSDRALEILESAAPGDIIIARLTSLEVTSALVRRSKKGDFDENAVATALRLLDDDVEHRCRVVDLSGGVLLRATSLVRRHALRAADAIQLACALIARGDEQADPEGSFVFVSSDQELNAAGQTEGLVVVDPARQTE